MGSSLNKGIMINETDVPIFIQTYNYVDGVYMVCRHWRQVPLQSQLEDQSDPVQVDGLAGGGAVQVAVLYNIKESTGQVVRDIFTVPHGATLTIQGITDQSGVTKYIKVGGVKLHTKGQVSYISKEMAQLMVDITKKYGGPLFKEAVINAVGPMLGPKGGRIAAKAIGLFCPQSNNDHIYSEILTETATEAT